MSAADVIRKNLAFWHWYPRLICEGLTDEQVHWQPADHPNHIAFTLWHAFSAEDRIVNGFLGQRPAVIASDEWTQRLGVPEGFGADGLDRERIAALHLDLDTLLDYADAVRESIQDYLDGLTDEEAAEQVDFPFFEHVYPGYSRMTRSDAVILFSVGHLATHLGEVQYIKGLMGLQGAAL